MAKHQPDGIQGWIRRNSPNREELMQSRWLRPFGSRIAHSELGRFTRRSVPRGVALGLLVGIFLLIPGVQIIGVALLALPFRANIPIGAAMTFLSNPATTPFLLGSSIVVGNRIFGLHADVATFSLLWGEGAGVNQWVAWFFSDAAPALLAGLFIISVIAALIGYVLSIFVWRLWVGSKWRRRGHRPIEMSTKD